MSRDLYEMSLAAASAALETRKVSSVELTRACIARAEAVNPTLNCFLAIDDDDALAAARKADARIARGERRGPLDGVPMAHKDMFYRAGKRTTGGSKIRRDFVPSYDSDLAKRLDAAGAVWFGSLNMSEFAANPAGHNVHYGHCRNPWDPESITGGSSSGSGASVAARASFASVGSDTGGSVRLPAAICGVVGLKPTYGRVSRYGAVPRSWSLDTVGPLARTAEDCALLFSAIAGHDPMDSSTVSLPVPDYRGALSMEQKPLRIGIPKSFFFEDVDASVRRSLDAAFDVLAGLGMKRVDVEVPDMQRLFAVSDALGKSESAAAHVKWIRERPEDYSLFVRSRTDAGYHIPATTYLAALSLRSKMLADFAKRVFDHADVLFAPVLGIEVPKLAATEVGNPADVQRVIFQLTRCTRPINYLGLPGLSVPCGFSANGMPTAFQLIGRPFSEKTLLRLAHAYQGATDWHLQTPRGVPR